MMSLNFYFDVCSDNGYVTFPKWISKLWSIGTPHPVWITPDRLLDACHHGT